MREYFIRRFLLIPPTLLGVTLIVFAITRLVPGGPIEHFLEEAQKASEGASSSGGQMAGGMNEEQIEKLEEEYGYDKPIFISYLQWLGVLPRERFISKSDFRPAGGDKIGTGDLIKDPENEVLLVLKNDGRQVMVKREEKEIKGAAFVFSDMTLSESTDLGRVAVSY